MVKPHREKKMYSVGRLRPFRCAFPDFKHTEIAKFQAVTRYKPSNSLVEKALDYGPGLRLSGLRSRGYSPDKILFRNC